METKLSKAWYRRVGREWNQYVGSRATIQEYTAGGAPYLTRLLRDLTAWWGKHPEPAKRLTPEEIEPLARRLADLLDAYTGPITPPETADLLRPDWVKTLKDPRMRIPEELPKGSQMITGEGKKVGD